MSLIILFLVNNVFYSQHSLLHAANRIAIFSGHGKYLLSALSGYDDIELVRRVDGRRETSGDAVVRRTNIRDDVVELHIRVFREGTEVLPLADEKRYFPTAGVFTCAKEEPRESKTFSATVALSRMAGAHRTRLNIDTTCALWVEQNVKILPLIQSVGG